MRCLEGCGGGCRLEEVCFTKHNVPARLPKTVTAVADHFFRPSLYGPKFNEFSESAGKFSRTARTCNPCAPSRRAREAKKQEVSMGRTVREVCCCDLCCMVLLAHTYYVEEER